MEKLVSLQLATPDWFLLLSGIFLTVMTIKKTVETIVMISQWWIYVKTNKKE